MGAFEVIWGPIRGHFEISFRQLREQLFQAEERFKFANKKETELQDLANDLSEQYSQARDQLSSLQKN